MCISTAAYAEKWVGVVTFPKGHTLYVDTDSVSRKGDLSTIAFQIGNDKGTFRFDCARNMVEGGTVGNPIMVPVSGAEEEVIARPVFKKACKRAWEVWK